MKVCDHCTLNIPAEELVYVNGRPFHVEPCFAQALKRLKRSGMAFGQLEVELGDLSPRTAYLLGKQAYPIYAAWRTRRPKKKRG